MYNGCRISLIIFTTMMHAWGNYSFWGPASFVGFGAFGFLGLLFLLAFIVIELALKGYALWYAAKRDERWWFVVMLVINTAGLLELGYLFFVVKKWHHHCLPKDQTTEATKKDESETSSAETK